MAEFRCPICKKPVDAPPDLRPAGSAGDRQKPGPDTLPRTDPSTGPDAPRPHARLFPFCSERCKLIDLGRWLDGVYQVPVVERDEE